MVAETFKLSHNLKVILQPYLRTMENIQRWFHLPLKHSDLWGEMKHLFYHSLVLQGPGLPVPCLTGQLQSTRVSSHLPSAFTSATRRKHMQGKLSAWGLAYVILIVAGIVALTLSFVASASELLL